MPKLLRQTIEALPGVALAVFLFLASVGPMEARSNLAKWAKLVHFEEWPPWLTDKRAMFVATLLVTLFYLLLYRRKQKGNEPPPVEAFHHVTATAPWNETLRRLSTEQLRGRAKGEAQRLRTLEADFAEQEARITGTADLLTPGMTPEQVHAQMRRKDLARDQLYARRLETYLTGFHGDAVAVRTELWHRLGINADDPRTPSCLDRGVLSGVQPLLRAADEIDGLAAQLI
jgi:hypothetical protein